MTYKNATCRGAYAFGTQCGHCERCADDPCNPKNVSKSKQSLTKQEILEEFDDIFEEDMIGFKNGNIMEPISLSEWLSSALDRYTMAVVEASLPSYKETVGDKVRNQHPFEFVSWEYATENERIEDEKNIVHNACREAILTKAREITKQPI